MVATHVRKDLFARAVRLGIEGDLGKIVNELLEAKLEKLEELEKGE